jgi:4-amino-4-deoxy-L-arabinose transferase-like glycosyltransferase
MIRRLLAAFAPALFFVAVAWPALRENSATYDETEHVPAAYTYLTRADYRLGPEHPPLLKDLFALPLLPIAPRVSADAERAFAAAAHDIDAHWIFGDRFLYRDNRPQPLLLRARAVALGLGAVLVLLVFAWTREAFGSRGALLAATLLALDPSMLAHATLATTDAGYALFFFAALYFVRRTLGAFTGWNILAAGAALGAAFASKHSAVLLVPAIVLFALLRLRDRTPWPLAERGGGVRSLGGRAAALLLVLVFWGGACWGSLWAVYGFRYAASADGTAALPIAEWARAIRENQVVAEAPAGQPLPDDATFERLVDAKPRGISERVILASERWRLLPEAYLFGLAFATAKAQFRWGYFLGEISGTGRRAYFPVAFLVKTPLATLALLAAALALGIRAGARALRSGRGALGDGTGALRGAAHARVPSEVAYLLVPPVIVLGAAMASNLNIGYRHVLPMLPFLYVLAGSLPGALGRLVGPRAAALVLGAASLLVAAETLAARPHFLPFFNLAAGGATGGLRLLSDSNLDWGQGLPALRRWMDEQRVERINLCYFGTADPAAYGIRFVPLTGSYLLDVPGAGSAGWPARSPELPGYVAVSATHLQGTYLYPSQREAYAFLRRKRPVAVPGGSIYVYWVTRWGD